MIQDIICQTQKITSPTGVPILRREYFFSPSHASADISTAIFASFTPSSSDAPVNTIAPTGVSTPSASVSPTAGSTRTPDSGHRTIDEIRIASLLQEITGMSDSSCISDLSGTLNSSRTPAAPDFFNNGYAFSRTGWESWDAGWETMADERTPRYIPFLIPALKKYIEVPESSYKKENEYGQFIIWLRWNNYYLVAASTGNAPRSSATPAGNGAPDTANTGTGSGTTSDSIALPPVQYELCRKTNTITCRIYSTGKIWKDGEKAAEISFFLAKSYFELKDTIRFLFRGAHAGPKSGEKAPALNNAHNDTRFENLAFLGKTPGGWESWYNHYNKIDESLILEDLNALNKTENLIKCMYIDKKQPVVFQIDDGWQEGTGQWEINEARFPHGFEDLTEKIREKGYIPGLWIAPFIFDYRVPFIKRHPDWILRDKKGKPIPAGFNAPWGAPIGKEQPAGPHNYFALDLSRDDVLLYLDELIDRAINEWGFRYLKLDFLFAGMLYGCFTNGGAAYEWYDRAIKVLTKRTKAYNGEPVTYLGCGMPFESSFNRFPLSRIGADTKEAWDYAVLKALRYNGRPSAYVSVKDTLGHAYWNDAVYKNDPDVVFFRKENCTLTDSEKELIALVNKLFAGQIMYADDPARFNPAEESPLTQKILVLYDKFEGAQFGNVRIAPDIYAIFSSDCKYTGIINLTENKYTIAQSDLQKIAQLQAYGNTANSKDAPRYKLAAGQGNLVETATGLALAVSSHSIYIQEKEL